MQFQTRAVLNMAWRKHEMAEQYNLKMGHVALKHGKKLKQLTIKYKHLLTGVCIGLKMYDRNTK